MGVDEDLLNRPHILDELVASCRHPHPQKIGPNQIAIFGALPQPPMVESRPREVRLTATRASRQEKPNVLNWKIHFSLMTAWAHTEIEPIHLRGGIR